jgi:hypothetical protein
MACEGFSDDLVRFRGWPVAASLGGQIDMLMSQRHIAPGSHRLCSMGHLSMTTLENRGCYLNRRRITCRTPIDRRHVTR